MGAYTDTYIKISKVDKETIKRIVEHALWSIKWTTYGQVLENGWEKGLADWLKMHEEEYDYFVKECGVDPSKMTKEYLTEKLRKKVAETKTKVDNLNLVLEGKLDLLECLKKTHMLHDYGDVSVRKYKGEYYINPLHEIFRNYEYDQLSANIHTVEDLINHLKQPHLKSIKDLTVDNSEYGPLTPELEQKIRDYYGAIGDNNFLVNFG